MEKLLDYNPVPEGSLTEVTTGIVEYLRRNNWVCREGINDAPIFLLHYLMFQYVLHANYVDYKKRVLIQPVDGQRIKNDCVSLINVHDVVLTPSSFGKKFMEESGVDIPIYVVPNYFRKSTIKKVENYGINSVFSGVRSPLHTPSQHYTFYHESTLTERKNALTAIKCFLLAFSDSPHTQDVKLTVKGTMRDDNVELIAEVERYKRQFQHTPRIEFIPTFTSQSQLVALWHQADAYVSFAHIEGFGIPLLRMATLKKPIITLKSEISGYMDFLSEDTAYLVESRKTPMGKQEHLIFETKNTEWEDVLSLEAGAEAFIEVYQNRKNPKVVSDETLAEYEYGAVMEKYVEHFQV